MAKLKVSELTRTTTVNPNDLLYVVQSNESKSILLSTVIQNVYDEIVAGNVTLGLGNTITTDGLTEGTLNLYYTNTRVRSAINVVGSATYYESNGTIDVRGGVTSVNGQTGNVNLVIVVDTDDTIEGSNNLYFTNARVLAGIASQENFFVTNIIPLANEEYNLGSPTARFKTAYFSANTLDLGGSLLSGNPDGSLSLPAGSTIGGLNVGSIQILGTLANTSVFPASNTLGDGYIIDGNLYVWTDVEWIDVGQVRGPAGPIGPD